MTRLLNTNFFLCALLHNEMDNPRDITKIIINKISTAAALTVPATIATTSMETSTSDGLVEATGTSSGKQTS